MLRYTLPCTITPLLNIKLEPLSPTFPLALLLLLNVIEPVPVSRMDQMPEVFAIATAVPLRLVVFIPQMGANNKERGPPLLPALLATTTWTAQSADGVSVGRVALVAVVLVNLLFTKLQ